MIVCTSFRTRFAAATDDPALLDHLRTCDRCFDFAASVDPDVMFRALGGNELLPPGGVDAFVDGVMQQVRVRDAEQTTDAHKLVSWPRRFAVAAAVAASVFGATFVYRPPAPAGVGVSTPAAVVARQAVPLTTKPVVESYDSQNATILEMPSEAADDVQIVMIFDENLPADL